MFGSGNRSPDRILDRKWIGRERQRRVCVYKIGRKREMEVGRKGVG